MTASNPAEQPIDDDSDLFGPDWPELDDDGASVASVASVAPEGWPNPIHEDALIGIAGEVVRAIEPHTESDPQALLVQFLVAFGNVIGRGAHARAEADRHGCNLFAVAVGDSSKGRKGTSWGHVKGLFEKVDRTWFDSCLSAGLSSGEGLIYAVRDPGPDKHGKPDAGVAEKRRLLYESEFAGVLRTADRQGNVLSATLRQLWESGTHGSLVKSEPVRTTDAHISLVGHITRDELRRYFKSTEAANGFGNRILWACARRSKLLPEGGAFTDALRDELAEKIRRAVEHGRTTGEIGRTDAAKLLWRREYPRLSRGERGLIGAILGRAEAQVLRLSVIYALLDRANEVDERHLRAALALWRYCEDSARWIFGSTGTSHDGTDLDGRLYAALVVTPDGLTRTEIRDLFSGHEAANEIDAALERLREAKRARSEDQATGGRPAKVWFARSPLSCD